MVRTLSRLILILLFLPVLAQAGVVSDTVDVVAIEDDAVYDVDFDSTATFYYLSNSAIPDYTGGARFLSVGIDQGTTVDTAFLILDSYQACSNGECRTIIYGEDADNSAVFNTGDTPADRDKTSASKTDSSTADNSPNGRPHYTFDVTNIVQEIVNRGGWSSGNNLSFLIEDNGSTGSGKLNVNWKWDTYDSEFTPPRLIVWWTEGVVGEYSGKFPRGIIRGVGR